MGEWVGGERDRLLSLVNIVKAPCARLVQLFSATDKGGTNCKVATGSFRDRLVSRWIWLYTVNVRLSLIVYPRP